MTVEEAAAGAAAAAAAEEEEEEEEEEGSEGAANSYEAGAISRPGTAAWDEAAAAGRARAEELRAELEEYVGGLQARFCACRGPARGTGAK